MRRPTAAVAMPRRRWVSHTSYPISVNPSMGAPLKPALPTSSPDASISQGPHGHPGITGDISPLNTKPAITRLPALGKSGATGSPANSISVMRPARSWVRGRSEISSNSVDLYSAVGSSLVPGWGPNPADLSMRRMSTSISVSMSL